MLSCPNAWGVLAFTRDDYRFGVWLCDLDDDYRNLIPKELWEGDPDATLEHHISDTYTITHGDGSKETVWPDGSLLRVSVDKDGSPGNPSKRGHKTERFAERKTEPGESERQPYTQQQKPPVDVEFSHSSGARISITADGSFDIATPKGHRWRMYDATEKARDPESGAVTATPDEDAQRIASAVVLESEMGHKLTFQDDPQQALNARLVQLEHAIGHKVVLFQDPATNIDHHVTVESGHGHKLELRDTPASDIRVTAESKGGHKLTLRDAPAGQAGARLESAGGRIVEASDGESVTKIIDPVSVLIDAPAINLGSGGGQVARAGDPVQVQVVIASGSSAGTYLANGTIQSGSGTVRAKG
jgi:hypothetical protein